MKILVAGGAGFIGSCFVRLALQDSSIEIVNIDKLTYAWNLANLTSAADHPHYRFQRTDICDLEALGHVFEETKPDAVVHFAAESPLDRSIFSPQPVFETNLRGTFNLLENMRARRVGRFIHVSTDEVYGSLEPDENFPLQPSSPYSASKAGLAGAGLFQDLPAASDGDARLQTTTVRTCFHPLMISNALEDKALPVYGDGMQAKSLGD